MKYCTHCGHQLPDEAVFCTGCGCPVSQKTTENEGSDPAPKRKVPDVLSIVGFVFAIIGLVATSLVFSIAGLVICIVALNKVKRLPDVSGKGFATAGIAISSVGLALSIVEIVVEVLSYSGEYVVYNGWIF